MEYISLGLGLLIIVAGLWGIITQNNIFRIIIAFSIFNTGTHILIVSLGYIRGRTAPIIDNALQASQAAERAVDPIPQALVLTAIVIGVGITALMLAYVLKLYEHKGSLDIKNFKDLKW